MNKTYLMAVAAALLAAPLAFAHSPAGTPKFHCEEPNEWLLHEYAGTSGRLAPQARHDGGTVGCSNGLLVRGDGHPEYAEGGAVLLSTSGAGVPSADPSVGAGSLYCYGEAGHHANFITVRLPRLASDPSIFIVGTDTVDLTGTGEGCGDFEPDNEQWCIEVCSVTFSPGLDGAYQVMVVVPGNGHVEG